MLFPTGVAVPFAAQYTSSKVGKTGLSPSVTVYRIDSSGAKTTVVATTTTGVVEVGNGVYHYLLASSNTGTPGTYYCVFSTSDTTVDNKEIPAVEIIGAGWVATAGAAAAPGDILATPANKLATDGSGRVTVGGYASGQAPLQPTVAGRTLDVSSGGEAGVDWNNIGSPTATQTLSGTTISAAQSVTNDVSANVTRWRGNTPADLVGGIAGLVPAVMDLSEVTETLATLPTGSDIDAILTGSHGGGLWQQGNTVPPLDSAATAVAVQNGLTAQGYTSARAGYLDTLNGLAQAIWDKAASALATAGSIGKLLVDRLDEAVGSRMASFTYTAPPTVGAIAAAVWDEDTSTHQTAGSSGRQLTNNAAGSDPLANEYPGAYAEGTYGELLATRLPMIGSSSISVASPVTPGGDIEIYAGFDYYAADSRALEFSSDLWPDLTGATEVVLLVGTLAVTGAVVVGGSGVAQQVRFQPTAAQTATLRSTARSYGVKATLQNNHVVPLAAGLADVKRLP